MKITHFLFLALLPTLALSEEYWIADKSKLPSEFTYLIESIQKGDSSNSEKKTLGMTLEELSAQFSLFSKEELFILLKGEIYRSLLSRYKGTADNLLEDGQIEQMRKKLLENGSKMNAFALWLMIALSTDAETLLSHPKKTLILKGSKSKDLLRLRKKMSVITPWVQNFLSMDVDEFHNELRPLLWDILKRIENRVKLFNLMGRFEKIPSSKEATKFFSAKEAPPRDEFPELENWLRRQDRVKNAEEKSKIDSWLPKEDEKNSNYVPPALLPKPVDDWGYEGEEKPDKAPKALPKPVDDWILDE